MICSRAVEIVKLLDHLEFYSADSCICFLSERCICFLSEPMYTLSLGAREAQRIFFSLGFPSSCIELVPSGPIALSR